MNDLDARLAAHFARLAPPADLEARLAARLAVEQEREARRDRAALLREALAIHEGARRRALRERRRAIGVALALALAALGVVALTRELWGALGLELAQAGAHPETGNWAIALFALLALGSLAFALRRRLRGLGL